MGKGAISEIGSSPSAMIALQTRAMEDEVETAELAAWCSYESPWSLESIASACI
jgi:hypothetical protein